MKEIKPRKEKFGDTDILAWDYDGTHEGMLAIRSHMTGKVGGSDQGIILGVSNFYTPAQLMMRKLDLMGGNDSVVAVEGHLYEDAIISRWECHSDNDKELIEAFKDPSKKKREVERLSYAITNPEVPYGLFNIDGKVVKWEGHDVPCVMDAKFLRGDAWRRYEGGHIPQYIAQGQFYMMGTGCEEFSLAVQTQGYGYQERHYKYDTDLAAKIEEKSLLFLDSVKQIRDLLDREEPDHIVSQAFFDLSSQFGPESDTLECLEYINRGDFSIPSVPATEDMDKMLNRLIIINEGLKSYDAEKKYITSIYKKYMLMQGTRSITFPSGGTANWGKSFRLSKLRDRTVDRTGSGDEEKN